MRRHRSPRRRRSVVHGARARRLAEARWTKVCEWAFGFLDAPQGIPTGEQPVPHGGEEVALLDALGLGDGEVIRPLEFDAAMTGDELLAWLERSLEDEGH